MSTLAHKFNKVAIKLTHRDVDVPNCLPPFSIRFTFEERVRLDEERGRKTLAAHIDAEQMRAINCRVDCLASGSA